MEQETEKPFADVLDEILAAETMPIALLYRLSDLNDEQLADFSARFTAVSDEQRRVLVRHLADISEENYRVDFSSIFLQCFQDSSTAVRKAALDGLWDETNPRMIDPILTLLQQDPAVEVRAGAAAALAHYVLLAEWGQVPRKESERIVSALLVEYEKPNAPLPVKRAALEAMGAANHSRVQELISAAYQSGDLDMKLSAVFAMGSNADEVWLPQIMQEMENEDVEIRIEAARAAGAIGHEDALPALARLAVDEDLEVGLAVVEALSQIEGDTARRVLEQMAEDAHFDRLRDAVEEALEEMDLLGGEFKLLDMLPGSEEEEDDVYLDEDNGTHIP